MSPEPDGDRNKRNSPGQNASRRTAPDRDNTPEHGKPSTNRKQPARSGTGNRRQPIEIAPANESEVVGLITLFERAWHEEAEPPRIEDHITGTGADRAAKIVALVEVDIRERLRRKVRAPAAEDYLRRFPDLLEDDAVTLIVRDYKARRDYGTKVSARDYIARFPQFDRMLEHSLVELNRNESKPARASKGQSNKPNGTQPTVAGFPAQLRADFEPVRKLGKGGMGEVWLAKHHWLKRESAIKLIHPHMARDAKSRKRLLREARAMDQVATGNPHAVAVYDAQIHDVPYIEMEFVRGRPLDEIVKQRSAPLPIRTIAQILQQLCEVLEFAHKCRIIHRDLKPSNLMLVDDGFPEVVNLKVLDFGLARFADLGPKQALTLPGTLLGSAAYMSPEQFRNPSTVDGRSDIFSVGVILYELLVGCRPFVGQSNGEVLLQIAQATAPRFNERNPKAQVDPEIEELVLRCLEKDPRLRPQSARELAVEFLGLVQPKVEPAVDKKPDLVAERPWISRRWFLAGAGAAGLSVMGAVIWWRRPLLVALPSGWRAAKDAEIVEIAGSRSRWPTKIDRTVAGAAGDILVVRALLIPHKPRSHQPASFYIMENKVWVGLFKVFAQQFPQLVQNSNWNESAAENWPALGVTGPAAQAFAEWLGGLGHGSLPTDDQWLQAAGKNERCEHPYLGEWTSKDGNSIAVGRDRPMDVGAASQDVSIHGCRDMSGNGWEWIRPTESSSSLDDVVLRAARYDDFQPFSFNQSEPIESFKASNRMVGFRIVIELLED
jgi:serine/threonine protein kinase